jgi:hypothetical protein
MKCLKFSAKDLLAAHLLVENPSQVHAAKESGLSRKTIQRRMAEPRFLAYMDQIRAKYAHSLSAPTEEKLKKLGASFAKADGLEFYLEMAHDLGVAPQFRLQAMKEAMATCGYDKPAVPLSEDDDIAEKPDVYVAAWMRTPQ